MPRMAGASPESSKARQARGSGSGRWKGGLVALAVLLLCLTPALAMGDGSVPPSSDLPEAILQEGDLGDLLTNPQVADELPHSDLDRSEAVSLIEGVFEPALESPAGMFADLEAKTFLSDYAAIVPSGQALSSVAVGDSGATTEPPFSLLESTLPLRIDGETVDLSLDRSEAGLHPDAPIVEVGIPNELGAGIALPETDIEITLPDAPEDRSPSIAAETTAMYPNVATDSDFVVAPTPTGVETFTTLRSSDAPHSESFHLSLPPESELRKLNGGALVTLHDEPIMRVLPPTAYDANGAMVPVALDVSGSDITVTVTPDEAPKYPVIVDPIYETYWWLGGNEVGSGDWVTRGAIPGRMGGGYVFEPSTGKGGKFVISQPGSFSPGEGVSISHSVPRLAEEEAQSRYPTSYITSMNLSPVSVLTSAGASSPYALAAIFDAGGGSYAGKAPHQAVWGYSGNAASFSNGSISMTTGNDHEAKIAYGAALQVNESAWAAGGREMYFGGAAIETTDEDLPHPANGSISGWVNQVATGPITADAEDTGLGVKKISFEIPGQGTKVATNPCPGTTANPCPLHWTGSIAASEYKPSEMPQGFDWIPLVAEDVIGHKSTTPEKALIRVDHTAPVLATLSGTIIEQAKLATKLPSYKLKLEASDGTESAPQSGVVSTTIKVDGKVESEIAPGCTSKNCAVTREWTLESRKYSAGTHTVEVIATDGVGLTASKTLTIELQPDSTAPTMALTGSITEQATLGTSRPQYKLKLRASDGTLAEEAPTETGVTAAYAFDETSGTTAKDSAGSHTATVTSPSWVEGKYGKALSFNGTSSCVSVPNSVDLQLSGSFTLSAWVNSDHAQEFVPIFYKESKGFYSYSLYLGVFDTGHVEGFVANESPGWSEVASPEALPSKTWTHLAFTSDGTTLRLYVNGKQVSSGSARAIEESDGPLYIGCFPNSDQFFKGQIDNVRIYNKTLSATEIEAEKGSAIGAPSPPPPAPSGAIASWALDETSGTTTKDSTGNGHTGTVTSPSWVEGKYGKALSFNGTSSCVSVPNTTDLQLKGPFTLETWVKPSTLKQGAPIFFKESEGFYGYSLFFGAFTEGHVEGFIAEPEYAWSEVESPEKLAANAWAHLALTFDGTNMRLYVNGKQVDSGPAKAALESKGPLLIGCAKNFGEYFKGTIDNVRVYSRALTAAEIEADKAAAVTTSTPAPLQSGIASTEITVDGKAVGSSTSCTGDNCNVATEWTLPSSSYLGKHTVLAKATDGFGNVTSKSLEINVQSDTAKPTIETGGALSKAPSGWVEQEGYGFTASAKDAGYGVTSLALKIDGTQVASSGASCPDGGCQASIQKTINMAPYSGGAHPAEVIATDGAGNTTTEKWTINVDPKGTVTAGEVNTTVEAMEATEPETYAVAPTDDVLGAEERSDGNDPGIEKVGTEEWASTGTPVDSTVITGSDEALIIGAPQGDFEITPVRSPATTNPQIVEEVAAVVPSTSQGTDTIIRPKYNGLLAFQTIREPVAPEQYSWEVDLLPGATLKTLEGGFAGVFYSDGSQMMLIEAMPAHDATGKAVPTNLSVTAPNIVTLTVEHAKGSYTYPVETGPAFEVGYATVEAILPQEEDNETPSPPISEAQANWFISFGSFEPYSLVQPPEIRNGLPTRQIYRSQCGPSCSKWNAKLYNATYVMGRNATHWEPGTEVHAKVDQNWKYETYIWPTVWNCGTTGPSSVKDGSDNHLTAYAHFTIESWFGVSGATGKPKESNFTLFDWIYPSGYQVRHVNFDWGGQPVNLDCPKVAGT
jgi:Concanavalin A-like lectin/glucanases superfamily